jgi:hypothetical protein
LRYSSAAAKTCFFQQMKHYHNLHLKSSQRRISVARYITAALKSCANLDWTKASAQQIYFSQHALLIVDYLFSTIVIP